MDGTSDIRSTQSAGTAGPFDAAAYPRTYRIRIGWRLFAYVVGSALICGGAAMAWPSTGVVRGQAARMLYGMLLLGLGVYALLSAIKTRVTLTEDSIELVDVLRTRRLRREEIRGVHVARGRHVNSLVLEPRTRGVKCIKFGNALETDAVLRAWLMRLPNLDAEQRERARGKALGGRQAERAEPQQSAALRRSHRIVAFLTVASLAVAVWALVYPRPYDLVMAILVALPPAVLVLVALSRGVYRLDERHGGARPRLEVPFMLPGPFLALRALLDVHVLEWTDALVLAVIGGVLLVCCAWAVDGALRRRAHVLVVLLPFAAGWGYGGGMYLNARLDRAPPEESHPKVVAKQAVRGRRPAFVLTLSPWGPRADKNEVYVSRRIYHAAQANGTVCTQLRPGALGVRWFTVRPDPARHEAASPR